MNHSQPIDPFSKRFGFRPGEPPITMRDAAPDNLRYCILDIAAQKCGCSPSTLREIVCAVLRQRPDPSNWSEYPNVWWETVHLVDRCEWFQVYDIAEAIYDSLASLSGRFNAAKVFENEVNQCYRELGIGWQLINGCHDVRGDDAYESILATAKASAEAESMPTARNELAEAIHDLSRRPMPDLSGAMQHAMAALEAVARDCTGDSQSTLGEIVRRFPAQFPRPLDDCIAKAWGYASENARHGRETRILAFEEAQLIVGLVASLSTYLLGKRRINKDKAGMAL